MPNLIDRKTTNNNKFSSDLPYSGWAFSGLLMDGGGGKKAPLPKISHTYITMMKLGTVIPCPKKIKKIYESRGTTLDT